MAGLVCILPTRSLLRKGNYFIFSISTDFSPFSNAQAWLGMKAIISLFASRILFTQAAALVVQYLSCKYRVRVLSRIFRLGEKFRVVKDREFPRGGGGGSGGMTPRKQICVELQSSAFGTQFCEMLPVVSFDRECFLHVH